LNKQIYLVHIMKLLVCTQLKWIEKKLNIIGIIIMENKKVLLHSLRKYETQTNHLVYEANITEEQLIEYKKFQDGEIDEPDWIGDLDFELTIDRCGHDECEYELIEDTNFEDLNLPISNIAKANVEKHNKEKIKKLEKLNRKFGWWG